MMWKIAAILFLAAFCVNAEDEQPTKDQQLPSLFETVLCYASPKPRDCVRAQASRMLDGWEKIVNEKRQEMMVEADDEMKEDEVSRGLSDEEKKEKPSQLMSSLDRGLDALTESFVDIRGSRALSKQSKDVSDETNDFNDDFIDSLGKDEFEGKLTDEARGKQGEKQAPVGGNLNGNFGVFDDDSSFYGYGYKGKGKKGGKKKKKKGLMKLFFIGAILKSKIELLLKILSFKLQLKFFAIAAIGLLINIARFWIDLKKQPHKVVHVEHAQHQHHYEDHDDWGSSWKRQAQQPNQDSYQQESGFAHRLAYNAAPQYSTYPQY